MNVTSASTIRKVAVRESATLDRRQVVQGLIEARNSFLEVGSDLHEIEVSAGFVLQDICDFIGLTKSEKKRVLGKHYVETE